MPTDSRSNFELPDINLEQTLCFSDDKQPQPSLSTSNTDRQQVNNGIRVIKLLTSIELIINKGMEESRLAVTKPERAASSENNSRFISQPSLSRDKRPANTVSMYVGVGKQKILPKPGTALSKHTVGRRSQSQHNQRSQQQKTLIRYRKLDASVGQASFSNMNPLKEFKRQTLRSQVRAALFPGDRGLRGFLEKVESLESQFVNSCHEQAYGQAAEVIIKLLNYAVDYNLPDQFMRALKLLADLNFLTDKFHQAFFYYDQTRQSCLLLDNPVLLVESLMGLAACCGKSGLQMEGIRILKKALQYAWMNGLLQLQLRLYDQMGKLHYHLGDLQKARQYHTRHVNALYEPNSSALRLLSQQRVTKAEQINLQMKYNEISMLLLVHLKAPIKSLEEVPLPFEPNPDFDSVRNHFNISSKYYGGEDVAVEAKQLLRNWFFRQEMEDLSLPEGDWANKNHKKFAFLDFQLNQQLKRLETGGKRERKKPGKRSLFPVKQSLQQQVARKMKEPPLEADWYQKIVHQINRDHKNKLLNVRDAVRIRGFNKKMIPPLEAIRDLYNTFFERPKGNQNQHSSFLSRDNSH